MLKDYEVDEVYISQSFQKKYGLQIGNNIALDEKYEHNGMGAYMEYFQYLFILLSSVGYVKIFGFILLGYLFVMYFDFKRIKKILMEDALKNVE